MEKPKTLNDMRKFNNFYYLGKDMKRQNMRSVSVKELKQEAIKWIKNCEICPTARPIPICSNHKELAKFNNITEEEIKW